MGFHSFTGSDHCSAFFGKGKQTCWRIMIKNRNSYVFFRTWRRLDPPRRYYVKSLMIYGTSSSKRLTSKRIKSLTYFCSLHVNRLLDWTLFDVTLWPKSGKTQTYVLYRNSQLITMVGLGDVKFSGLKRFSLTILSNCCQRAVMTRILKKTDSESSDDSDFEP